MTDSLIGDETLSTLAACDYSTKAEHWAIFVDKDLYEVYTVIYSSARDLAERLAYRLHAQKKLLYPSLPDKLPAILAEECQWYAIEGYVHYQDTYGKLAGVHWYIRTRMAYRHIKPLAIAPADWKKRIGLKGNANKDDIKAHILNLYPDLPANLPQDAYDAVGIGKAACSIVYTPQ